MAHITSVAATFALLATLVNAQVNLDPKGPSLRFNWTLAVNDVPVELTPSPINNGWIQTTNGPFPHQQAAPKNNNYGLNFDFWGEGFEVLGSSPDYWNATDVIGKTILYSNSDPTVTGGKEITAPTSPTIITSLVSPRFQKSDYTLSLGMGTWGLDGVVVRTGMQSDAHDLASARTMVQEFVVNGTVNPFFNTSGRWEVDQPADGLPLRATCFEGAKMTFPIPNGASYVVLNGTRDIQSVDAQIHIRDSLEGITRDYIDTLRMRYQNSTTALLYMAPLDPTKSLFFDWDCVTGNTQGTNSLTSITFYAAITNATWDDKVTTAPGASGSASGSAGSTNGLSGSGGAGSASGSAKPTSSSKPSAAGSSMPANAGLAAALVGGVAAAVALL